MCSRRHKGTFSAKKLLKIFYCNDLSRCSTNLGVSLSPVFERWRCSSYKERLLLQAALLVRIYEPSLAYIFVFSSILFSPFTSFSPASFFSDIYTGQSLSLSSSFYHIVIPKKTVCRSVDLDN